MGLLKKAGAIERVELGGSTYLLRVPDDYARDDLHTMVTSEIGKLPTEMDVHKRFQAGIKKYRLQSQDNTKAAEALDLFERWKDLREELREPFQILQDLLTDRANAEDPEAQEGLDKQLAEREEELRESLDEHAVLTEEVEAISEQLQAQWQPYRQMIAQQGAWLKRFEREALRFVLQGIERDDEKISFGSDLATREDVESIPREDKDILIEKANDLFSLSESARKNS